MLKQNQYDPLPIEKEVLIIFAANEGYFDKLEITQVKAFEQGLYAFSDSRHKDILEEIKTKREISDDLRKRMRAALDQYQQTFAASQGAASQMDGAARA
jgi:F-type H+/Na+-transporting ATPase subunit alpha